jgi:hypothetical protein
VKHLRSIGTEPWRGEGRGGLTRNRQRQISAVSSSATRIPSKERGKSGNFTRILMTGTLCLGEMGAGQSGWISQLFFRYNYNAELIKNSQNKELIDGQTF